MKTTKRFIFSILGIAILSIAVYIYHVHFNYRYTEIAPKKVYQSAAIPQNKIKNYIEKFDIKTVVDLRIGNVSDPLNPGLDSEIIKEKNAVEKIEGVRYVNIPSEQIPSKENLKQFFDILDQSISYPVLIHCHHGTGRAVLYSALYRIEYEGLTNEEARLKTRPIVFLSPFDHGAPKGEWLKRFRFDRNEKYAISTAGKNIQIKK